MTLRLLAILAGLPVACALCRYTVRDVGFVDLGDPGYQYYAFVSDAESPGSSAICRGAAQKVFSDTNVEFEVVDLDGDARHPARLYLSELDIQRFPTTVLVHPDGNAIELPLGDAFEDAVSEVFESVASSKLRRLTTAAVLDHYCVVLLFECDDAQQNQSARQAIQASFVEIEKVFDQMPKAVGALPELIALPRREQAGERVLLWALGIQPTAPQPMVAVLTGRARQIGPLLDGAGISSDSLLDIISKVGESCECELDRSWMRGLRIPLRWDADTRQQAADMLGFDPDSPLVKAEISSIVARGPGGQVGESGGEVTVADLLLGYSEQALDFEEPAVDDLAKADPGPARAEEAPASSSSRLSTWIPLGCLVAAYLGLCAFMLVRARRRSSAQLP